MPPILGASSTIALFLLLQPAMAPLDLQRLDTYAPAWSDSEARLPLADQARADFGGRGVDIANHFLRHTGPQPRNDAFYFVLRAVAALAWLSAGAATGAAAMVPRRARRVSSTMTRVVLTLVAAASAAGVLCVATRSARLFPSDLGGWELIVDPLGAAIIATGAAAILLALEHLVPFVVTLTRARHEP